MNMMSECSPCPLEDNSLMSSIDKLYSSIEQNPNLLGNMLVQTPLHDAVIADDMELALEIMTLNPSLGRSLNPEGLTPLHVAVQRRNTQMALSLVEINNQLVREKGKGGLTPLHCAAKLTFQQGDPDPETNLQLMAKMLMACPEAIEDVNNRSQTVLHVSLEHGNLEMFKLLLGWVFRRNGSFPVVARKDKDRNTTLHLAAKYDECHKEVKMMTRILRLNLSKRNSKGKTPLDIAEDHGCNKVVRILRGANAKTSKEAYQKKSMPTYLRGPLTFLEKKRKDKLVVDSESASKSDAVLVVAVLIATATYQTALQPPGGFYPANLPENLSTPPPSPGKMVMGSERSMLFVAANTGAFVMSMSLIMLMLHRCGITQFMFFWLYVSLIHLSASYVISVGFIVNHSGTSLMVLLFCLVTLSATYAEIIIGEVESGLAGSGAGGTSFLLFHRFLRAIFPAMQTKLRRLDKINGVKNAYLQVGYHR